MTHDSILAKVNEALMIILIVSSPVLIAAVVIGLLVGLLQALTQIQDQTLPQAVKLVVVLVLMILLDRCCRSRLRTRHLESSTPFR